LRQGPPKHGASRAAGVIPCAQPGLVLTTHNMEEAEQLCHRIAIMDHGRVVAEDTPDRLIRTHAPKPPAAPLRGSLEDVFLALTGHELRE